MADVVSEIVSYFQSKGLPNAAIAAILGNMQTESGFNTSAANGAEGAIGLAQWEGGRRTNLQNFAASEGKSETDLGAQLDFMWHELNTSYSGVLQQMKTASDPAQAAAIWDGQYEVSSGSSRQARIQNAVNFSNSGLKAGAGVESAASMNAAPLNASSASATPTQTPAERKAALEAGIGPLASLLATVPELSNLLSEAVSKGWTAPEFQNAVDNSTWYRSNSDTVRAQLALKASDPASYKQNFDNEVTKIQQMAKTLGVTVQGAVAGGLANNALLHGWTDQTLQNNIGQLWSRNDRLGTQGGQAAQVQAQIKQTASDYGLPVTDFGVQHWTQQILSGQATIDGNKASAINQAKTMYAPFAKQIDAGQTVRQIADPYIATKANLLEVAPDSINFATDPAIKKALQGTGATASGQEPTALPLWQFEQQVRQDPAWQYTNNAKSATAATLTQLGKDWGFSS